MSLFDMQGMNAEDSKAQDNGRSALSLLSTGIGADCRDSTLSALAGVCNG